MKSIVLVLLLALVTNVSAQNPKDAAKHIGAGVVIGGIGGYAAHKITNGQRAWKWAGAVGSSLAAGLAKETFYDKPKGANWETKDILYTTLGGALSAMALDVILDNTKRRTGGGKSCGCLVAQVAQEQKIKLPSTYEKGSRDIASELQAAYYLK